MPSKNHADYSWRRMQLEGMWSSERVRNTCAPAIATADSILSMERLYGHTPSLILRGTAARHLIHIMAMMAGFKKAPMRTMKALIRKLCPPEPHPSAHRAYPFARVPSDHCDHVDELVSDAAKLLPYLRTAEAKVLSGRCLRLIEKTYGGIPERLNQYAKTFVKFEPHYPTNELHEHRLNPLALLNAEPQGSA